MLKIFAIIGVFYAAWLKEVEAVPIAACLKRCTHLPEADCVKMAIEESLLKMKTWIIPTDNIEATKEVPSSGTLEPFKTDDFDIYKVDGIVRMNQTFKNVYLHGITNSDVLLVRYTPKMFEEPMVPLNWTLEMTTFSNVFRLNGDYNLRGYISEIPVNGSGKCNITLGNVTMRHTLTGDIVNSGDGTGSMLRAKSYALVFEPETVDYNFENLFKDEQVMATVRALSKKVFEEVKSGYENIFGDVFMDLTNKVFHHIHVNGTLCVPSALQ